MRRFYLTAVGLEEVGKALDCKAGGPGFVSLKAGPILKVLAICKVEPSVRLSNF